MSLLVGVVALSSSVARPAPASEDFVPGSVTARSAGFRFGGFTGGLEYALTMGIAVARVQGIQANAQSQVLDLGVFGLLLSAEGECTGTTPLPPERVPRPLRADSVGGERTRDRAFVDGRLARGGTESVSAMPGPAARAVTDVGELNLAPLVTVDGVRAVSDASIAAADRRRTSTATTTAGTIDIGGLVRLEGVRWTVAEQTGGAKRSSGAFTVGRIVLAGAELPSETTADLADAFDAINGVLATLGIELDAPVVRERDDGTLEVTPLVMRIGGVDQANPVLGALMAQLQPIRDAVYEAAQNGGCPIDPTLVNAALTVFDIVFAGLTGSGGFTLEVGGTRTLHDVTVFDNPLGPPPVLEPVFVPGASAPPVQVRPGRPGSPPRVQTQAGVAGRTSSRCETTHPSGSPGCSGGRAALAGFLSLGVAGALLGADAYRGRRRRASS